MFKWNDKVKKSLIYSAGVIGMVKTYDYIRKEGNETLRIGATGQLTLLTAECTLLYSIDSINMKSKMSKGENKSMGQIV